MNVSHQSTNKSFKRVVNNINNLIVMDHTHIYLFPIVIYLIGGQKHIDTEAFVTREEPTSLDILPTNPRNVAAYNVTSNSIVIGWTEPEKPNGIIEGYRIYYRDGNFTDVQTYKTYENSTLKYNLTNLWPDTNYEIWVKAFTGRHEGNSSASIFKKTDIAGPSSPSILNLTCQSPESIFIQWGRPAEFYKNIDYYFIYLSGKITFDNFTISATKDYSDVSYMIKNLTTDKTYKVQVGAATYSDYTKRILYGTLSEARYIQLKQDCDKIQQYLQSSVSSLSVGIIAGVICVTMALLFAITAFILWRRYFYVSYCYLEDHPCSVPTASLDWNVSPDSGEHRGPVPVSEFNKHVAELHADGDCGFSREYEAIQADSTADQYPSEHSQHPDNRAKNRYLNIIAYDHSRVQLLQMPGHKKNIDYINANYIDGFQWSKAYIGTQGPLPSTFDCFWRMIWEQRVAIIVMITNLVERGRKKCDMYWPKEGTDTYGVIQVKLVKEDVMATYTVRTLQIKHLKVKKRKLFSAEKTVYQYHYTNWPDHGTPDHPLPVLHFVKKSASANLPNAGPVVVHCSAGVGRTGAYIVLDAMLRQIRQRREVNIFGFLKHIRSQRNFLVQTEEQYIFIHDALLEAIQSGETNIPKEEIARYVNAIQNEKEENTESKQKYWKPLDYQFKLVTSFQCKDFNLVSANKSVNANKNRCQSIVPVESSRVHLTPKPGEEGSDYINASWIQGFHSLKEFIITQHPLKETIRDFWQMVWDHNAQILVLLSIIDEEYEVFWPVENGSIEGENFKVNLLSQEAQSDYIILEFSLQSLQDDYELHVRMIHSLNWPHACANPAEMYTLPTLVQELPSNYQNGPIVVIDRFGGTEAATFCSLTTLKKQLAYENHADVYMYAKLYHNWRPGIWNSVDDYLRLHLAVQALCAMVENIPESYAFTNGTVNGSISSSDCVRVPPEGMEAGVSHQAVA
ncbi:tyrosine-protein phosphatase 99A [Agrilus planipennis]|uniref:Tyrosine-protein phosphatase 99A n=1 Tax=Agrilus planipennis TaxID=224129 RepID=A0A1W4XQ02_AGRPL|nr:tyrosine-protein phosphatase 99A [Agrilus planipennis]